MRLAFFLLIVVFSLDGSSQVPDTARANRLTELGRNARLRGNYDSAYYYIGAAADLSRKTGYLEGLSKAYTNLSFLSITQDKLLQSLTYGRGGLFLAERLNDTTLIINAKMNLGTAERQLGNYPSAIEYYLAALRLSEHTGNLRSVANGYNNLGNLYASQNDLASSIRCFEKSIETRRKFLSGAGLAGPLNNLGNVLIGAGRYEEANKYLSEAYRLALDAHDKQVEASCLTNLGTLWYTRPEKRAYMPADSVRACYLEALKLYRAARVACGESPDPLDPAGVDYYIGRTLTKLHSYREAREVLESSLTVHLQSEGIEFLPVLYSALSQLYEASGDAESAYRTYRLSTMYTDSIANEENTRKTVRAQMNYEFGKREAASRAKQEKKDALAASEKRRQQIILWSISAFGLLVLGFAIFAYRSFLQKKKANEEISRQKSLIEEKQREILDSIHYAKRIQQTLLPAESLIERYLRRVR